MTRNEFIRRLRSGLKGMPAAEQAEMVADYEAHFDAGAAEGRSETEIAEALGNPARLARELRLEAGIKQWREDRSPSAAWTAVVGILGLATIDILILVPIILPIIASILALYVACGAVFFAGGVVMIAGPFADIGIAVNGFALFLLGLGLMAFAISAAAIITIVTIGFVNAMIWFGRLHYRVIQPAITTSAVES
jgi:uncharacterized membrane protein